MYGTILGSILPHLVPIVRPSNGVNPIEVSIDLPFTIAVMELPLPMWQVIILELLISKPANAAPFSATKLCEVP